MHCGTLKSGIMMTNYWHHYIPRQAQLCACDVNMCFATLYPETQLHLYLQINRASGGLTPSLCQALGPALNSLYGYSILYKCDRAEGTSMTTLSYGNYNSQPVLNKLRHSIQTNYTAIQTVSTYSHIYMQRCVTQEDEVVLSSRIE